MPSFWLHLKNQDFAELMLKLLALVIVVTIFIRVINNGQKYNKIVNESDLVKLVATLSNQPAIKVGSEGGPSVSIELQEYPRFGFAVFGGSYYALKARRFVLEAHPGDTITIDILKEDLNKIHRSFDPMFPDNINYTSIQPFSLMVKGKVYMSLEDRNREWADNNSLKWFLGYWIAGLGVIVIIIYLIFRRTGLAHAIKQWFPF